MPPGRVKMGHLGAGTACDKCPHPKQESPQRPIILAAPTAAKIETQVRQKRFDARWHTSTTTVSRQIPCPSHVGLMGQQGRDPCDYDAQAEGYQECSHRWTP